ncbi:phosphoribosyltransferase family protein [Paenibacillus oralis]|uniref:phosphoribosyltransferase family protein n=1 Tax=Paenibacillus oralis TaxID=2490856 RepID=UPI0015B0255C|nr:phosphoribosyltransferase family protein [Paenibacillus oralis]
MEVEIEILDNPFQLPLEALFQMAARINKKRSFLFVSKVLGKHIPVVPEVSLLSGAALAYLYQKHCGGEITGDIAEIVRGIVNPEAAAAIYKGVKANLLPIPEPALFIGFAETATALGHSMYAIFSGPAKYIHTTRDVMVESEPTLTFEEEHSHATAHRCYPSNVDFFRGDEPVVLVDDEITTGKTALNIIRDLHQKHPRSRYVLASLLDWRSDEDIARFKETEAELKVTIDCLSLIRGQIKVRGAAPGLEHRGENVMSKPSKEPQIYHHEAGRFFSHVPFSSMNSTGDVNIKPYLAFTGRFGLQGTDNEKLDEMIAQTAALLKSKRAGGKTLCLGTGEFMYIPMRIAAEMGEGIYYQSSTRSPIHPFDNAAYGIKNAYSFDYPDDAEIGYFFYNINEGQYDEIFVFVERSHQASLESYVNALKLTETPTLHFVHFN